MAKKSNKTEHVLKLITKNDDAMQDDDFFAMEEGADDEIKLSIKSSPERELKYEAKLKIEIEPEIEFKIKDAPVQEIPTFKEAPAKEIPTFKEVPAQEAPVQEAPMSREVPVPGAEPAQDIPMPGAEPEEAADAKLDRHDNLVNIAEILAREKLTLVMEKMKVCSCRTCVNDVLALALNSLPTKYVTTDSGKQYFQLDIYKKQYETDILAALTKACVRVKASPRH